MNTVATSSTPASRAGAWPLTALALSMLLSTLGTSIANVALPTLAQAFGAGFQQVQWVVLAYLLVISALIVSAGRLGDLLGRRRVLLIGLALFTLASCLCAAAPGLELLIAARALQGLGACAMMALTMAFVADTVPKERTGRAMGLLGTLSAVGTALGPTLGGLLIAHANWRAIFLVNLPLGLLALLLAWRCLPAGPGKSAARDSAARNSDSSSVSRDVALRNSIPHEGVSREGTLRNNVARDGSSRDDASRDDAAHDTASDGASRDGASRDLPRPTPRFDHPGTLLLALALVAYALAMTLGRGGFGTLNLALLAAAFIVAALFLRHEARAASPLIAPALLRDRPLTASLAANAAVATIMMATLVVGPFYLARALGLAAAQVGLVLSIGPLASALAGLPAGRLADRFGAARMSLAGLSLVTLGAALLAILPALLPSTFGIPGYVAPILVTTAGYALFQAANNSAVMAGAPPDRRGLISGMLNLSRNLGLITGASLMGAVFAWACLASGYAPESAGAASLGMRVTFGAGAVLAAAALAWLTANARGR
jgi:MFS family permease